jgi:hypothetical protein
MPVGAHNPRAPGPARRRRAAREIDIPRLALTAMYRISISVF